MKLRRLLALPMAELCAQSIKTGPEVGQQVPAFSATDQNGRTQDLKSIMGPKGGMLVFLGRWADAQICFRQFLQILRKESLWVSWTVKWR